MVGQRPALGNLASMKWLLNLQLLRYPAVHSEVELESQHHFVTGVGD